MGQPAWVGVGSVGWSRAPGTGHAVDVDADCRPLNLAACSERRRSQEGWKGDEGMPGTTRTGWPVQLSERIDWPWLGRGLSDAVVLRRLSSVKATSVGRTRVVVASADEDWSTPRPKLGPRTTSTPTVARTSLLTRRRHDPLYRYLSTRYSPATSPSSDGAHFCSRPGDCRGGQPMGGPRVEARRSSRFDGRQPSEALTPGLRARSHVGW